MIVIVVMWLFLLATNAQASIVVDNFNSYVSGPVVGQGDWFDRANGETWLVQDGIGIDGTEAIGSSNQFADSVITKTGDVSLADGSQSFYVRTVNHSEWGDYSIGENFQLGLFQDSWDGPSRATLAFMKSGQVAYIDPVLDVYVGFDDYTDNIWNLVTIEWRSQDASARYRLNEGSWTSWIAFYGGPSFTGFDTIGFVNFNMGSGEVWIDSVGSTVPGPSALGLFVLGMFTYRRRR